MKKFCVLAFGSNEANAAEIFSGALALLAENNWQLKRFSSIIRTTPVDCLPGTPDFFNGAALGEWGGSGIELLQITQRIERYYGRPAVHRSDQARTLDIDIILLGREKINLPELVIPHPRAGSRDFVLLPMKEIAPDLIKYLY